MDVPRRTPRIGNESTRTGLAARMSRSTQRGDRDEVITSRGADELLAKAREAGADEEGPDETTLSAVESLLRDV